MNTDVDSEIIDEVKIEITNSFQAHLQKMILFGSYARHEQNQNSDIDIMLLTDYEDNELNIAKKIASDISSKFLLNYNIYFSLLVKNFKHFEEYSDVLPFYKNVKNEGIVLWSNV